MTELAKELQELAQFYKQATIHIYTLGQFVVFRNQQKISSKEFGRDKTLQLLQYLISNRQKHALHKEKIMEQLWEDWNDRDFKVALHGINKALEPNRPLRTPSQFIERQGVSYQLVMPKIWVDVAVLETYIKIGNKAYATEKKIAKKAFTEALNLYKGDYLPNRIYEDWSSEEREKIQLLVLNAYTTFAEIILEENPIESIRLAQAALAIDNTWETAYKLQMKAYLIKGNRPQAIKTYLKCKVILEEEYGIAPLPETDKEFQKIKAIN